ncbi:MAG: hypothetical protein RLZZ210_1465 [Pseudomonadota bacterium]|jgi:hypothetical protein
MFNLSKIKITVSIVCLSIIVLCLHIIGLFKLRGYAAATIINVSMIDNKSIQTSFVTMPQEKIDNTITNSNQNNQHKNEEIITGIQSENNSVNSEIADAKQEDIPKQKANTEEFYAPPQMATNMPIITSSNLPNIDTKLSHEEQSFNTAQAFDENAIQNLNQDGSVSEDNYPDAYTMQKIRQNEEMQKAHGLEPIIQNISHNLSYNKSKNNNIEAEAKQIASLDFPKSQELKYQLLFNHVPSRKGSILWSFDGKNYTAKFATSVVIFGDIIFESSGIVTPQGLVPTMYKRISGKKRYTTTFDIATKKVHFSRNNQTKDMPDDVKDFTSVAFQIMAMVRKNAPKQGTKFSFNVATDDDIQIWDIICNGLEKVELDEGSSTNAWHFTRVPRYNGDKRKIEWWLEPSNNWLIAKFKQTEPSGTEFEFVRTK